VFSVQFERVACGRVNIIGEIPVERWGVTRDEHGPLRCRRLERLFQPLEWTMHLLRKLYLLVFVLAFSKHLELVTLEVDIAPQ